jgi:GNAT superfamily N-acetyltransferase
MGYRVTTAPAPHELRGVHELLASTYWSPRIRPEIVDRAIANSIVAVALAEPDGGLAGFARVVSDRATFAWLCDVVVVESHRGRGVASLMIRALEAHPDLQGLRRWCLATRDAHGLYERHGYTPVTPNAWMERKAPPSAWQAPDGDT